MWHNVATLIGRMGNPNVHLHFTAGMGYFSLQHFFFLLFVTCCDLKWIYSINYEGERQRTMRKGRSESNVMSVFSTS
jgi:hypothetical protein